MSETPQGPGWWMGVDQRWYPPELHPQYGQQPQTGPPAGAWGQPAGAWGQPGYAAYAAGPPGYAAPGAPATWGERWSHHREMYFVVALGAAIVAAVLTTLIFVAVRVPPADSTLLVCFAVAALALLLMALVLSWDSWFEMTGCLGFFFWGILVFASPDARRVIYAAQSGLIAGACLVVGAAAF